MNTSSTLPAMPTGFHPSVVPAAQPAPLLPFCRITVRTAIWSLLLGLALVCPALLLISLLPIESVTPHRILNIAQHFPLVILASVVVGPLLEEVIFRGAIIQLGRRYLPLSVPVVGSILLFAAIHFPKGPGVVLLAAPMGALLTWMALRSGSLWSGLICHAAFNMAAFIFTAAFGFFEQAMSLPAGMSPSAIIPNLVPPAWLAGSVVLGVVGVVMLRRDFSRNRAA